MERPNRGRARGRTRIDPGQQQPGGRQQVPRPAVSGPGMPAPQPFVPPQPQGVWGQAARAQTPAAPPGTTAAGRAQYRTAGEGPSKSVTVVGAVKVPGNGGGDSHSGRGAHRGRRELPEVVLNTRLSTVTKQGSTGRKVSLQTNYFRLEKRTDWCLFQYRVDFAPEIDVTFTKKKLFYTAIKTMNIFGLFDGTVMYSPFRLAPDPQEVVVDSLTGEEKIRITIRMVHEIQRSDYHYIQVYNLIVRRCMGYLKLQLVGRDFYDPHSPIMISALNLELWPGVLSSMRQHETDLLLCCEIKHKVMKKESALDLMNKCMNQCGSGDWRSYYSDQILNTVVITGYNNKTYHIDDVDYDSSPASSFEMKDGSKQTFAQYYQVRYGIRIGNMKQPLLISKAKARDLRAGAPEIIKLVPELCRMTGLTEEERANRAMMTKLADYTRPTPQQRITNLRNFNKRLQTTKECLAELNQWELALSKDIISLTGRQLPPEALNCNGGKYVADEKANWQSQMRSKPSYRNIDNVNWGLVVHQRDHGEAMEFVSFVHKAATGMQWRINKPFVQAVNGNDPQTFNRALDDIAAHKDIRIIMVIIPKGTDFYNFLKKKLSVEKGILSQMITKNTLYNKKGRFSICTKVAIQMNCKLGGAPWTIRNPMSNCMFCGYDVCHDPKNKSKSYGAFVATYDQHATQYWSSVDKHGDGEELSNFIGVAFVKAIKYFEMKMGTYPAKILYYRDGVGDGQIPYVYEHELKAIKDACQPMYAARNQKFCLRMIVVNKRINTRFFLNGGENPGPGTVVDDVVTMPDRTDFYLIPQCTTQGTVSPTYYNVLGPDEFGLDMDKTQRITYSMCHQYFNWSGTVRVPAPCQYAHKLAFLTSQSLQRPPKDTLSDKLHFL